MKKSKYLFILLIIFAFCALCACDSGSQNMGFAEITGIKEINVKVGEGTDEKLLEGVYAVLSDGSKVKPDILKDGFDLYTAGRYTVTYLYGNAKKSVSVNVYGMPKIYFGDTEIVSDRIEITFGQAMSSYDFVKGVKAFDSFGEPLSVEKSANSDEFMNKIGEYNVRYSAEDIVGNTLSKDVTFVVTAGNSPTVVGGTYSFDANGCKIPCDLKGEKYGLVFDNGELLNPDFYGFDKDNLIFTPEYCLLNLGDHDFTVETAEGVAEFTVSIADHGYPLFEIPNLNNATFIYGAAYSSIPADTRTESSGYTYNYILKNSAGEVCKTAEKDGKLIFCTADDECVPAGNYALSVIAAVNGKTSRKEYEFTVKYPTLTGGEESMVVSTDQTIDGVKADYCFEKADGSDAWSGRLYVNAPAKAYNFISFYIYFDYCERQEENKVNAKLRAVVNSDYERIIKCVDKTTDKTVNVDDILIKKWYKITVYAASDTDGAYIYVNPYGSNLPVGVKAYISDFNVVLSNGASAAFKSTVNGAVSVDVEDDGTLVTILNYNGSAVHTTPFSDEVWAEYLVAQTEGGKIMRFDVKFSGSATYNGHINNASTYMSNTIRGNRNYVRFYDAEGAEIAYANLATDTWYKMAFDIDAIKARFGEMNTVTIAGHDGSSLRFGANIQGETIYVKNVEFVDKVD